MPAKARAMKLSKPMQSGDTPQYPMASTDFILTNECKYITNTTVLINVNQ